MHCMYNMLIKSKIKAYVILNINMKDYILRLQQQYLHNLKKKMAYNIILLKKMITL